MQVQRSAFLQAAKPLLQSLVKQLSEKYGYVSVLAADTRSKYYRVGNSGVCPPGRTICSLAGASC